MNPQTFARAVVSIEAKYGLRLDATEVWRRLDGTPCGKGWTGTKPGCKRVKKTEKSSTKNAAKSPNAKAVGVPCAKGWEGTKPGCKRVKKNVVAKVSEPAEKSVQPPILPQNLAAVPPPTEAPGIAKYKVVKRLGKGAFGTAVLTDRGTVVKTANGAEMTLKKELRAEYKGIEQMYSIGIGPKPIGMTLEPKKQIEMEAVKGSTLFSLRKSGSETEHQSNQVEAARQLFKLHSTGWAHGDAHHKNIMKDESGVIKFIDGGYTSKVGEGMAETGFHDMQRVLEKHPLLTKLEGRMESKLKEYRMARTETFNRWKEPKEKGMVDRVSLSKQLHSDYLKEMSDLFELM